MNLLLSQREFDFSFAFTIYILFFEVCYTCSCLHKPSIRNIIFISTNTFKASCWTIEIKKIKKNYISVFVSVPYCFWWRKMQPIPVFVPGKSHGQRSLAGYSPLGRRVRHNWAHRHLTVLITIVLKYSLKSENMMPPALFFFLKIVLGYSAFFCSST